MQDEQTIFGTEGSSSELNVAPPIPSITPKPGWQTSQGQMTAIFGLICLILAAIGIRKTPDDIQNYTSMLNHLIEIGTPIVSSVVALIAYTISRGKTASNAINATALVQAAHLSSAGGIQMSLQASPKGLAKILNIGTQVAPAAVALATGPKDEWKDPATYQALLHVANQAGVPGLNTVDAINQQVPVSQLVTGILSLFHHKTKSLPAQQ